MPEMIERYKITFSGGNKRNSIRKKLGITIKGKHWGLPFFLQ
jgi:hypothetical protein